MARGTMIREGAMDQPPIWVGDPQVSTRRSARTNERKIPAPMGSLAALLGQ